MYKRKDVFTTGQVAHICNVAPRTVTKWFDTGQLKGYKIPGSKDRRIPASELIRFMKAHNMPTDMLETGKIRVMIIDTDWQFAESFAQALALHNKYEVETAKNSFDAGLTAHKFLPHIVLIDLAAENIDAVQVCANIRGNADLCATKIAAFGIHLTQSEVTLLLKKGFDVFIENPSDIASVIHIIDSLTSIVY